MARGRLLKMRIRKVDGTRRRKALLFCRLPAGGLCAPFPVTNSITHEVFNDPRPLHLHLNCIGGDGETFLPHKGYADR